MDGRVRVVIAIDFGTTFSGFAYALTSDPEKIYNFYEWPQQTQGGGRPYSKTITSVLYYKSLSGKYTFEDWGWPAEVKYSNLTSKKIKNSFLAKFFKLYLAPNECTIPNLPYGLSSNTVISDYLFHLKTFILQHIRIKVGEHIVNNDIQWCVTVPAMWDDISKQKMKAISQEAGLVRGLHSKDNSGSCHPLIIVPEPEAASIYCLRSLEKSHNFSNGDSFLVVDIGGGTVDLVIHQIQNKEQKLHLEEVTRGSGDLCGGIFVDHEFKSYMRETMGYKFKEFETNHPRQMLRLMSNWEIIKRSFSGLGGSQPLDIPATLSNLCEVDDEIEMTTDNLQKIFDPVIFEITSLIQEQLEQEEFSCKAIILVGGFSESPYLISKVKKEFGDKVPSILNPLEPGGAIAKGAVMFGLNSNIVSSRIMRKTYGLRCARKSMHLDPPEKKFWHEEKSEFYTHDDFMIFVQKGQKILNNESINKFNKPLYKNQTSVSFKIFSSSNLNPKFVTDPGCKKEGSYTVNIPDTTLGKNRSIETIMKFGTSCIEVTSFGVNVDSGFPETKNIYYS